MTTTDSAHVTPAAGGAAGVQAAERGLAGARAPAAVLAERRAWLVLWVAFATFCVLAFSATKFVVDWVSSAEINQSAGVTSTRGLVLLSLPASTEKTVLGARTDLAVGTVLWLDRGTWADLQLFDDSRVKLLGGSALALTRMEVGRFINQHAVVLTQSSGAVQYATGGPLDVQVGPNTTIHLAAQGDYTVWLDGDITRVMVYGGEARIGGFSVPAGKRVDVDAQGQPSALSALATQLLVNADFSQHDQGWKEHDVVDPTKDVIGERSWVSGPDDQMTALRVSRNSVNHEHGETGLVQQLDRNVSGYRHLYLRAWVRLDYADLSGGGAFGFEYPMMFRVKYEEPQPSFIPWSVGMYYANPENRTVPPTAAELWPQGEWKLFETDLMTTDPSKSPYQLLEFAVMGQGHSYDARVAGISLIGE